MRVLSISKFTRVIALSFICSLDASAAVAADKVQRAGAVPAVKAGDAALNRQLDAFITKGMADWKIPGLSIVVVNDKGVVYEKGFGVREVGKPGKVDQHTQFGMMSTTKAMTALALAMLVDEGKVAWDDPVTKHLPDLRLPDAYLTKHVTVRDALRHTSGVQEADMLWVREDMSTKEVLARLDRVPATTALRSDFVYNNVMYQVAGAVIEAASERFIASRILTPLGMSESFPTLVAMRSGPQSNVSIPHAQIDGVVLAIEDSPVDIVPAAGSVWSNAHDAGKWMAFLLAGGKAGEKRLVSEAGFKELMSPQVAVSRAQWGYPTAKLTQAHFTAYGLGWFLQDYRGQFVAMHTGSMPGRTAIAGMIPSAKVGVYVFGNLDHAEFRHALMWKVLDMATGAPARDWNGEMLALYGDREKSKLAKQAADDAKRIKDSKPRQPLEAYAGIYRHPAFGDVNVALEGGALMLRIGLSASNAGRLEHWHHDIFRARLGSGVDGWEKYTFAEAGDGSVGSLTFFDTRFTRVTAAPVPR